VMSFASLQEALLCTYFWGRTTMVVGVSEVLAYHERGPNAYLLFQLSQLVHKSSAVESTGSIISFQEASKKFLGSFLHAQWDCRNGSRPDGSIHAALRSVQEFHSTSSQSGRPGPLLQRP